MPADARAGWLADDRRMRIALTGGIASGKSTVADAFCRLGVPVIDADDAAHAVTARDAPALAAIRARFGAAAFAADGGLDRGALRELVFRDAAARAALEAIVHPAILARMAEMAREARGPYLLFVVPLLVEQGLAPLFDRVLVVDCAPEQQLERLLARDAASPDQARRIMAAQAGRDARRAVADDLLPNSAGLAELEAAVARLHENYVTLSTRTPFPRVGGEGQNSAP